MTERISDGRLAAIKAACRLDSTVRLHRDEVGSLATELGELRNELRLLTTVAAQAVIERDELRAELIAAYDEPCPVCAIREGME